ncbi:MAG: STAS/SEC14 domain-containing protein [Bacteroidales bacterium]|nr:STAS/SEC14 domain-containing protein [Bacteroidales bacterium]
MIKLIPNLPGNIIGFKASGKITGKDYETVLIPAIEAKLKESPKVRLLYYLGSDFTGYDMEAMGDDEKTGFKHLKAWKGIEEVSDRE